MKVKSVYVRSLPGETKEALILRKLGAGSLAHAVTMHKLGDYEGDVWAKLESLAANEVELRRNCNRLSRRFAKIIRASGI